MTSESIVAGLVSSLLTVIVTKLIDLFQKEREYDHSLRKAFFEKKLAVAESAVAKWYSIASTLSSLSALYDQFSKPDSRASGKLFDTLNQIYAAQLTKIESSTLETANSIYLYFDLDSNTLKNKEPLKTFYDILIEIQDVMLNMNLLKELKDQLKGTDDEQYTDTLIEQVRENARKKLKELSSIFDASQKQINQLLIELRSQMRKYEVK
jgi:hypothetical protein